MDSTGNACHFILSVTDSEEEDTTPVFSDQSAYRGAPVLDSNNIVRIAPNPANSQVQIALNMAKDAKVQIWLTDLVGRTLSTIVNNEMLTIGMHTLRIPTEKLAAGTYIIAYKIGNEAQQAVKLMIVH